MSHVRNPYDLDTLRDIIRRSRNNKTEIIAKIETRSAVENLDEIIEASNAVLVARGDLGITETDFRNMNGLNKRSAKGLMHPIVRRIKGVG